MNRLFTTGYYLLIAAIGLIGLMFVATLVPIPGNYKVKVVKSGSMEPAIRVGGIVVIKPASSYEIGDVITFGADTKTQIPTTHRIVAIEGQGSSQTFQTKGDANDSADAVSIKRSDIEGKLQFTVPYAGYVLAFARTKLGFFLLVGVPGLLVILEELMSIYREIVRIRSRKKKSVSPIEVPVYMPRVHSTPTAMGDIRSADGVRRKIQTRHIVGGVIGIAMLGGAALPQSFGDTTATYADAESSQANILQAGTDFNALRVQISDVAPFSLSLLSPEPEDPEQPADAAVEPIVEISDPVTIITEVPAE